MRIIGRLGFEACLAPSKADDIGEKTFRNAWVSFSFCTNTDQNATQGFQQLSPHMLSDTVGVVDEKGNLLSWSRSDQEESRRG